MSVSQAASHAPFHRVYLPFVAVAALSAAILVLLGYLPMERYWGHGGVASLIAGCGISMAAGWAGAVPVALALSTGSVDTGKAVLGATVIRFCVVLLIVAPLVLGGWEPRVGLVVSLAVSYLLMLPVDTVLAIRAVRRAHGRKG